MDNYQKASGVYVDTLKTRVGCDSIAYTKLEVRPQLVVQESKSKQLNMNLKVEKNRVYHPWSKWEDYEHSFYNNCTGQEKEFKLQSVLNMFNSAIDTERCMIYVVDNWTCSMEHNLTNNSMI